MDTVEQPNKKSKEDRSTTKFPWKLQPILADEFTQQSVLKKSFIGSLKDKKCTSKVISILANILPSPQHLKRCSGSRIYLAPVDKNNTNQEDLKKFLVQKGFNLSLLEDDFEVIAVPSIAPRTKFQMAFALKFWPVNFHPDLNLEALISGSLFSEKQLTSLELCMRVVISAAEECAFGSNECNGVALILDPEESRILSIAASNSNKHPMWHASMLAIDLIARLQGGGVWQLFDCDINDENYANDKRKNQSIIPLCYPHFLSKISIPKIDFLFEKEHRKINKSDKKESVDKCGPYLCTGYWAILLQEPCPLCAMALLHSRVSRIFYGASNSKTGILGSKAILHSVPGLNHRYQVWSGVLEEECVRALEKCSKIVD